MKRPAPPCVGMLAGRCRWVPLADAHVSAQRGSTQCQAAAEAFVDGGARARATPPSCYSRPVGAQARDAEGAAGPTGVGGGRHGHGPEAQRARWAQRLSIPGWVARSAEEAEEEEAAHAETANRRWSREHPTQRRTELAPPTTGDRACSTGLCPGPAGDCSGKPRKPAATDWRGWRASPAAEHAGHAGLRAWECCCVVAIVVIVVIVAVLFCATVPLCHTRARPVLQPPRPLFRRGMDGHCALPIGVPLRSGPADPLGPRPTGHRFRGKLPGGTGLIRIK